MIYPQQQVIPFEDPDLEIFRSTIDIRVYDTGPLHSKLNAILKFTDQGLPMIAPSTCKIPDDIYAFRKLKLLPKNRVRSICPHHFVQDKYIEPLWTNLGKSIQMLQRLGWTIAPDFSILIGMTQEQQFTNDFRNKFLSATFQLFQIEVIAAPAWGDVKNIEHFMDGWPRHSLVAVNSTGVCNDNRSRHVWLDGYNAMLDILQPSHILRYGGYIDGERAEISTYYNNDNIKAEIYGI